MFRNIPIVYNADQLIDRAIKKSKKVQIYDRDIRYKNKKTIIAKTESFSSSIINNLDNYVKNFPSIDNIHKFYQEIIEIKFDKNKLKKSLGAIKWARDTSNMIYSKQSKSLTKSGNIEFLKQKQKEIYGRISSVLKQIDNDLRFVAEVQILLKDLPDIKDISSIVIAGYPNVGKSSLLKQVSSAKPMIAQYPFTTKEIHVGHIEFTDKFIKSRIQIIDTPGLLDRAFSKRNEIEKQAIAALKYIADIIVFIIDPTETCGYSLEEQEGLLNNVKKIFKDKKIIIVENKSDMIHSKSKNIKISCSSGEGIKELIDFLILQIKQIS